MENTDIFAQTRRDLADDMDARGIGAIIWDNATAGFHFIPEINLAADDAEQPDCARVAGLYEYDGTLYLIEEDKGAFDFNDFYDADTEVRPSVVTLSPAIARKMLGDPTKREGFSTGGSIEEWLTVTDCYYEALNEAVEEQPE